jgi:hypothetical protein
MRFGRTTAGAADAKRRKPMDSSAGSAMTVPAARRKWRRVSGFVFMVVVTYWIKMNCCEFSNA